MRLPVIILLSVVSVQVSAQNPVSRELKFVFHLVNTDEYEDAVYYINTHLNGTYPLPVRDSLNYLKGWSLYSMKKLSQSASSLLQVSSNSPFFLKSRFFAAYNYSYLGLRPVSDQILNDLTLTENLTGLRNFELAGNSLLNRDLSLYNSFINKTETNDEYSFSNEKKNFDAYYQKIRQHKNKSMVAGGLLSVILPGSGKIYAGKTGEGISTFLIVAASGATAFENIKKAGASSAKTLLFSSLFGVLYVGNIFGGVFSVKMANEEFNHEMDNQILFDMHIPLRNIFD